MPDIIGWVSSVVLLVTIGSQIYRQWREKSAQGVSRWLFIGQVVASAGFVVYSWLIGNRVFVVTNSLIMLGAVCAAGTRTNSHRPGGQISEFRLTNHV